MSKVSAQSITIIIFAFGSFILAIHDSNFRETFGDIAKIGISGFIGYLVPRP